MLTPFKDINGKIVRVNIQKYRINWNSDSCSKFQTEVKNILHDFWKFDKVLEEFKIPKTRYRIDFLNITSKISVEAHGDQHDKMVAHFHKNVSGFLESLKRDRYKEEWLIRNDYKLIQIYPDDLKLFKDLTVKKKREVFLEKFHIEI